MPEPTLVGVAFDAVEEARKRGWLDKLVQGFKKKHSVIVLGSTGVGKTNFLASLKTALPEAVDRMNRTEFNTKNKITLQHEPFIFVDTPGQIGHSGRREDAIRDAMKNGATGIINVVCDGYHEYKMPPDNVFDADGKVNSAFLEQHRAVEQTALRDWNVLLGDPKTAPWLITVVTKADLWWDRQDAVLRYYEAGPYFEALGGASSLKPVVLPYCSVFHRFYDKAPMSGLVDDSDRVKLRTNLVMQLLHAVSENPKR